jgi:hypothetical protein
MVTGEAKALFRSKAPGIMARLLQDFAITLTDAAAIIGSFGNESPSFTAMQEAKPMVAGSRRPSDKATKSRRSRPLKLQVGHCRDSS